MESGATLKRFLDAQQEDYTTALEEIRRGRKRTHWMWYIFPQLKGLGFSSMANHYGIRDINEAAAYLREQVLGYRLIHISQELLKLNTDNATQIFGSPDDLKLRSSMTLFSKVESADPVFQKVIEKLFNGQPDQKTLDLLNS